MQPSPFRVLAASMSALVLLIAAPDLPAQFAISEFMSINETTLNDEDGENSDWIEIHNSGTTVADLEGWYLTDQTNDLTRWQFPSTNVPPNGYVVVFASDKDRRTPGAPLHTNFRLSGDGEYLALIEPDGATIASEFAPAFPLQVADVSFGPVRQTTSVPLLEHPSPARAFVPAGDELGASWTAVEFDDADWADGNTGIGYDRFTFGVNYLPLIGLVVESAMYDINPSIYVRVPFAVDNPAPYSGLSLRMRFEDGFVAYLNGIEVASSNAPSILAWNAAATEPRTDVAATNVVEFDLAAYRDLLVAGTNVLAIHALNNPVNSPDLLIVPELSGSSQDGPASLRYFPQPTPGAPNAAGVETVGPIFSDTAHAPAQPNDAEDILVTIRVRPSFSPVENVRLHYRVMFGAESTAEMFDDGAHGDGASGDGIYGATIPASASTPGQMVRWHFTGTDAAETPSRFPAFTQTDAPAYFGTVIADPTVDGSVPVYHWFVQNTAATDTTAGTRCSVFYAGQFYDNVFCRVRGASAPFFPKKPYKFDFNPGDHFRFLPGEPRMDEINLNTTYQDKAYVRAPLSFETYRRAGVPSADAFTVRVQRNGAFYSVAVLTEQLDETFLERRNLDPNGALYKMFNGINSSSTGVEKKTRRHENNADLQELVNAVAPSNPARGTAIFDALHLPEIINYLAAGTVAQDWDRAIKNIYIYRDTEGDGLWRMLPWDKDLSFGKAALVSDVVVANKDGGPKVGSAENDISHPFYGTPEYNCCGANNLIDAIYKTPRTREMYLRRLRTLMDEWLQPPATPAASLFFETRLDEIVPLLQNAAALDVARWGAGYGLLQDLNTAVGFLRTDYLAPRRIHLYETHGVDNLGTYADAVGVPHAQVVSPPLLIGTVEANPASGNQSEEFISLVNPNPVAVDVSGWSLEGGIDYTFEPGTVVPSQSDVYLSPDPRAFRARSTGPTGGQGLFVVGPYAGQLSARGETLRLLDRQGFEIAQSTWPANPSDAQRHLRITEIMFNPAPEPGDAFPLQEYEFLELQNISNTESLDLTGITLADGVLFDFTGSAITSLAPGERTVVVRSPSAFIARYGMGRPVAGTFTGALDSNGERIRLLDANREEILDFTYDNGWHPMTDGHGFSLVVVDPNAEPDSWSQPAQWRPSGEFRGNPGAQDAPAPNIPGVLINEILARTDTPPPTDSIELFNPTGQAVDVGGWFISDDFADPFKFRIPDGTSIPAQSYRVFDETDFNAAGTGFAFSSLGDEAWLFSADAAGQLTGYADGFSFGASANQTSWGLHQTSTDAGHLTPQITSTLGGVNAGPLVGPIVFSEIMYHPADRSLVSAPDSLSVLMGRPAKDTLADDPERVLEYIEISNMGSAHMPLFDPSAPTNTWRLRGGVEFDFPSGLNLPSGETILLVGFDPVAEPDALAEFEAAYGATSGLTLLGPWQGGLNNGTDHVELQRPDFPLNGEVPRLLVDRVEYTDRLPWPASADGSGSSLQRIVLNEYGNDPANWFAAGRSPGAANVFNLAPTITWLSPTNGAMFDQGAPVIIEVLANDPDGALVRIEIFDGPDLLGVVTPPTFSFAWNNPSFGPHSLTARAIDDRGAVTDTEPIIVHVQASPPTVSLTNPTEGDLLLSDPPIVLTAAATDQDGFISLVEFYDGPFKLGEASGAPFVFHWTNAPVGAHSLSAAATDNAGNRSFSATVHVNVVAGFATNRTLVERGAAWKYFDAGIDLGTGWIEPAFSDAAWSSGPAPLGYGDGDEATVVSFGPDPNAKYITTYFRHSFAVEDAAAFASLNLRVLRDDGALVYLNGAEIFRTGLAPGPVLFGTLANITVVDGDESTNYFATTVDASLLREGLNTLAVEIHQVLPTSSDISFDLELDGRQEFFTPVIASQPIGQSVDAGEDATFEVSAGGTPPLAYQWSLDGQPLPGAQSPILILNDVQLEQGGIYTVTVSNRAGSATSDAAFLSVLVECDYQATVLSDNPIHYYRFSESDTGQPAVDLGTPGGRPGTYTGGVSLNQSAAPLPWGPSARFDGAPGTYVDLGLFHPGDSVTVEAWVQLAADARAGSYHAIVARWDGSYELDIATDDRANLVVRNQNNEFGLVATPSPLPRGQWHHLAGVYDKGVLSLHVNGSLAATAPLAGTLRNGGPAPDRVLIGGTRDGSNSSFNWRGLIDEVALYDYAVPEHRLRAHYQAGWPPVRLSINSEGDLSWPAFPPGLILEESESLDENAVWQTNHAPRTTENGTVRMTVPLSGTQRFYRLNR